jgi:hypothetical protein
MYRRRLHICHSSVAKVDGNREGVKREEVYGIRFGGCERDGLYGRL